MLPRLAKDGFKGQIFTTYATADLCNICLLYTSMGMVYESQGNVVEYKSPTSDYVKQYEEIPKDGVLAQSRDVSK